VDVVSDVDANTTLTAPPAASFDISWFDPTTHTYYLADRSNASVDLIDARSGTFIGRIHGFQGVQPAGPGGGGRSGPNGIVVIPAPINQLWAGDGNSTVKVVDLTKGTIINTISTGGNNRADELAYDAKDQIIVIANDAETPPFFTFISVVNQTIISKLPYPTTTNGIEQPVWSPTTGHFYVAIPQSQTNPGGEIAELDPTTTPPSFVRAFALPSNCIPHGLALGPHPNAIVGCSTPAAANPTLPAGTQIISVILNITNGSTITITDVGGSDEVWYNPGDNRYYLAANTWTTTGKTGAPLNPVLGIIDAGTNTFIANEPTAIGAHSVAVDPFTNQVFVPFPNGAIGIFAGAALAQAPAPVPALDSGQTRLVAVVPDVDQNLALPAPPAASFDISWVDPTTHTYYLADRSNASVDLIDISSAAFLRRITGFRGVQPAGPGGGGRSGPNGIVVIPAPINQLWAGDGDSTVKVVDLTKGAIVNTISTGGNNRADELAYDSADQTLVVANDAESPPFFTFISTVSQTIVAKLPFPDATNGIEQSAWSPTTGLGFVAPTMRSGAASESFRSPSRSRRATATPSCQRSCAPNYPASWPGPCAAA